MADRIDAWDLFLKVAEFGSFSEAARRAGVSPGQVSKTISALEDQVSARLFERTTRAVRLTAEGEARLEPARALIEAAGRLRTGEETGDALVGTIRISAPVIYGARILSPLIGQFLNRNPGLSVRLTLTDHRSDLVADGLDMALRIGTLSDSSLRGRKLSTVALRLLASPALIEDRERPRSPAALAALPCVIDLNLPEPRRWTFMRDGDSETVRIDGRLETDSAEVVLQAVSAGVGVGLVPDFCLGPDRLAGLVTLLPEWEAPARDVWLLWPSGRHLAPRTRALVDYLASTLPAMQAGGLDACVSSTD